MSDIAKRAVACKRWRWMPGMLALTVGQVKRERVLHVQGNLWQLPDHYADWVCDYPDSHRTIDPTMVPDLDDPATLGCLLALVREAWQDQGLHCAGRYGGGEWLWHVQGGKPHGATFRRQVYAIGHVTEAEALVAALEAAPC